MYEQLEKVYLLCYTELYRYLIRLGCSADSVDDVIQNTFLEALKHMEQYEGKAVGQSENYCRVNYYRIKKRIRKEYQDEQL